MKFLYLVHGDTEAEAKLSSDERMRIVEEHMAYAQMLRDLGVYVAGEALDDPEKGAIVRPGRTPLVSDGPFAETKEAIGGFYVVDVESRDRALELAGKVPASPGVAVEVLKIVEF